MDLPQVFLVSFLIFFLFIPKCSCSLPLYLLSLGGPSFLSSLSVYSFIFFYYYCLSFLFYYITLLNHPPLHPWNPPCHHLHHPHHPHHFSPGCPHIHPLLSLLHRPTPTCPPMCRRERR